MVLNAKSTMITAARRPAGGTGLSGGSSGRHTSPPTPFVRSVSTPSRLRLTISTRTAATSRSFGISATYRDYASRATAGRRRGVGRVKLPAFNAESTGLPPNPPHPEPKQSPCNPTAKGLVERFHSLSSVTHPKICQSCKVEFQSTGGNHKKFCSAQCRDIVYRPARESRDCPSCGASFQQARRGQKYCSTRCRNRNQIKQSADPVKCVGCGVLFQPRRRGHEANRYCSRECSFKDKASPWSRHSTIHWWFYTCGICGDRYWRTRKQSRHVCSDVNCRRAANAKIGRDRYKPVEGEMAGRCLECGTEFARRRGRGCGAKVYFCSARCSIRSNKREVRARRRSKTAIWAEHSQVIRFRDVWDRDGGRCYICGKLCFRQFTGTNPLTPTLDHKIPLALGGTHTMENAGVAHFICNTFKGILLDESKFKEASLRAIGLVETGMISEAWALHPSRRGK